MGMRKVRLGKRMDDEGDIGIGTLIIFIAIVLVAAIAASLILYAAALLQQQAQKTVDDAVSEVSGGVSIVNVAGDRNPGGADSTIVSGYMPSRDDQSPAGGVLHNTTASADGVSPLRIVLNWTSAVDYGSGLTEEILYRTSVYDPTNPAVFNEQIAKNRLMTLSQLTSAYEIERFTTDFGPARQYSDYTVRDDQSTSYAYAIVGVDQAGNRVLYSSTGNTATTDSTTVNEDVTPPAGGSMTSTAKPDQYSVALFWVPPSDSGSGVRDQMLYRSEGAIAAPTASTVNGRTVLSLPTSVLLDELNATTSSFVDSPSEVGTYTYFVVAADWAGNQVYLGSLTFTASVADSEAPNPVSALGARQAMQAVRLDWTSGSDNNTFVKEYLVFRSRTLTALDSIEEVRALSPLAVLNANALNYSDFSGQTGAVYYYTVVTVDAAGNYAQPVIASNTIQMIEIKLKTVPGSDPILFTSLSIEITDGETDATLQFNAGVYGRTGADAQFFSVEILRDPDGTFASTYSLTSGSLVKVFINAGAIGLNLHAESSFQAKFIPGIGQPTLEMCNIPYLGSYRYTNLV